MKTFYYNNLSWKAKNNISIVITYLADDFGKHFFFQLLSDGELVFRTDYFDSLRHAVEAAKTMCRLFESAVPIFVSERDYCSMRYKGKLSVNRYKQQGRHQGANRADGSS